MQCYILLKIKAKTDEKKDFTNVNEYFEEIFNAEFG